MYPGLCICNLWKIFLKLKNRKFSLGNLVEKDVTLCTKNKMIDLAREKREGKALLGLLAWWLTWQLA